MSNINFKKLISNKKVISILTVIFVFSCIFYLQFYMRRASVPQIFGTTVRNVETDKRVIALSFDDGPNPDTTEKILSLLDEYDAGATFFMIGKNAEKYPDIVKKVIETGNEIGNHSYSHERLTYKSPDFIKEEIESTDLIIKDLGYDKQIPFRAPYGHKLVLLPFYLMNSSRTHYLWNIELNDWNSPPTSELLDNFINQLSFGRLYYCMTGTHLNMRTEPPKSILLDVYLNIAWRMKLKSLALVKWKK